MDRMRSRLLLLGLAAALVAWLVAMSASASAAGCSDSWTSASGGLWTDAANWSAGVPSSSSDVCITLAGTYTVTLEGGQNVNSLTLGGASGTQTLGVVGTSGSSEARLTLAADSTIGQDGQLVLDSQNAAGFAELTYGGVSSPTLTNDGTIDTQVEAGSDLLGLSLDNAATLEVKTGELNWNTGSTTLTNSGTVRVDSGAAVASTSGGTSFVNDSGGSVINDGSLTTMSDSWSQDGGSESGNPAQLTGGGTYSDTGTAAGGSFDLTGASTVSGTVGPNETLYELGAAGQDSSTRIAAGGATNDGKIVLDSQNGGGFAMLGTSSEPAGATWTNNGTIDTQVEGTGNGDYLATNLDNTGTVEVKTGELNSGCCSLTVTNSGNVILDSGGTFALTSGSNVFDQPSTGTLTVHAASGSSFGNLSGVGTTQIKLAGTLAASLDTGFSPTAGETLPIITASGTGVVSGSFAQVTPEVASNGLALAPQYSPTGARVSLEFEQPALTAQTGSESTPVGAAFPHALEAKVTDASGAVAGEQVTFTAPSSAPSGTFPGGASSVTVATDANGIATAPTFTADSTSGTYSVSASAPAAPAPASFSLTNLAAGQPGATLNASSLQFGTIGVGGRSAAQTVTVTDTGQGPLAISSATIGGAYAADFQKSSDSCSGQTLAVGATCAVSIEFVPSSDGTRSAALSVSDNTPNSPQSAVLLGTGTSKGTVSGMVVNGSASGNPPVFGASLAICPTAGLNAPCQSASTGVNGRYSFTGLQPGAWRIQLDPPNGSLFGASAALQVSAGLLTQDFTLTAPLALPADVTVNGLGGMSKGGIPVVPWSAAFSLQYPPKFPSEPSGTIALYITTVGILTAGTGESAPLVSGGMIAVIEYHGQTPVMVAQYADPISGTDPTLVVAKSPPTPTGLPGNGIIIRYLPESGMIQATVPSLNARVHGAGFIRILRHYEIYNPTTASQARLKARQPTQHNSRTPNTTPIAHASQSDPLKGYYVTIKAPQADAELPWVDKKVYIPPGPHPCPLVITPVGVFYDCGGAPSDKPPPPCRSTNGPAGSAGYSRDAYEHLPRAASSAADEHGVSVDCGNAYFDPSGQVLSSGHDPVPAARVVLLRASSRTGPFNPVPNGSLIMSPSNRRNPDQTNALGLFGWDVLPGFYRVTASRRGCTALSGGRSTKTRVYSIPPPVDNLQLTLRCPRLSRRRSSVNLRLRSFQQTMIQITALARGRHPTGLIIFSTGKLHVTIPLDPRTHRATFEAPRTAGHVTVRYLGDGYNQPSSARCNSLWLTCQP